LKDKRQKKAELKLCKMELSCPFGITRCVSQENTVLFSHNESSFDLTNIQPSWPHAWSITHVYFSGDIILKIVKEI